jgi:NADPH2:quinone reductase
MQAIRVEEFGAPDVMKLTEVPAPSPGTGQVLVRVHAAGVNPVDTYIRSGTYANKPALPYTPGSDAAGVVEAVGEEVTRFRKGDRVYTAGTVTGAYAQFTLCSAGQVYPLPANITYAQGAGIHIPFTTAYRALFDRVHARAGQTVLIHGATGGVGIAAVQMASAAGLTVIGTGGTEEGRALIRSLGAHHVLDHKSPDYLEQLMRISNSRGPDLILEMLANVNLAKDLSILGRNGTIVIIGSRGKIEIDPRMIMRSEGSVVGILGAKPDEVSRAHAYVGAGLRAGSLKPVTGSELPLIDAPAAHVKIMESTALGKIVLVP